MTLAPARNALVLARGDRVLDAAALALGDQRVGWRVEQLRAEYGVVLRELDQAHALPWPREQRDLSGVTDQRAALHAHARQLRFGAVLAHVHHLVLGADARELAPRTRAGLAMRAQREAQAIAASCGGHRKRRLGLGRALLRRRHLQQARIEGERAHDALAVVELEQLLHRHAVAGALRHVRDTTHVADATAGEERDRGLGGARHQIERLVAFPQARLRDVLHLALPLDPALLREQHHRILFEDEVLRLE
ncbi:MAG: Uncharacterized protein FD124_3921, partial [Alphaproteobacteria bacterium]